MPSSAWRAHAPAECSGMGLCDRVTGGCRCFAGFEGDACQRSACLGGCSEHGRCVPMSQLASEATAEPFGPVGSYGGAPSGATWDADRVYGCACDSAWEVGYGAGQAQAAQWHGADCSLQRCPSGDDPRTPGVDETDCEWMDANGALWRGLTGSDGKRYKAESDLPAGVAVASAPDSLTVRKAGTLGAPALAVNAGAAGNRCHVPCSNRGLCDAARGTCACFNGFMGEACEQGRHV